MRGTCCNERLNLMVLVYGSANRGPLDCIMRPEVTFVNCVVCSMLSVLVACFFL